MLQERTHINPEVRAYNCSANALLWHGAEIWESQEVFSTSTLVHKVDTSNDVEERIDTIILAQGYLHSDTLIYIWRCIYLRWNKKVTI